MNKQYSIILCNSCHKSAIAEGNCPNDVINSTGYIYMQDENGHWLCQNCLEKIYVSIGDDVNE